MGGEVGAGEGAGAEGVAGNRSFATVEVKQVSMEN